MTEPGPQDVLSFWFGDLGDGTVIPPQSRLWFEKSDATDEAIRFRFGKVWETAAAGGLIEWEADLASRLALVVVLDQFSRNLWRGSPRAFAQDARALALAERTVDAGEDGSFRTLEKVFLYLPFEHAEDLARQRRSVELFRRLAAESPPSLREYTADNLRYAERHEEIIRRFGRFPHRNAVLGRRSTPEEVAFLKEPMSSF